MNASISRWKVIAVVFAALSLLVIAPQIAYAAGPISWFVTSTVSTSNGPAWGRMLPWDKQGDNLVTYTEYPANGTPVIKVARSNPSVPTYTVIASIPSPTDHGGHIQEQSQMVQLSNGTILMAMRNRQTDLNWYGLPIVKSTDGGYTWTFVSQLDTNPNSGGRFDRGLWEPFLSVLPNGCIAGFYASEKHADGNPAYSQTVSERVSCDGGVTWGNEIFAAAQPGSARPGMPGFARMANGQFILVFEVCGTEDCSIHYKFSSNGTSWSNDLGQILPNQKSGPYVAVLSSGRILVTSACTNQISISDNNGASWYQNDPPAWNAGCSTWPAIYQTGYQNSNEVGVVVNLNGAIQIKFGHY
ncbi:sialidase family protein [Ktedonospora formicarum]|uniref:Exo-alpha-sialidase n=1 Tax=Ktedonospora formicarum TaxID=2778364 RepID=A0A8J3MS72_9CHLR|nr:sialidase family protein [Ktedonospora formicarum]GHO45790.1 hypothetical protein KSX_39530 [Ktedonospora formicarum]